MNFELNDEIKREFQARGIPLDNNAITRSFCNCMTVYYSTLTGKLFNVITGENDMEVFDGDIDAMANKDFVVIPFDGLLLQELHMYYFDLEEKRIRLKQEYTKYV